MRDRGRAGLMNQALRVSSLVVTAAVAVALTLMLTSFYAEWNPGGQTGYTGLPAVFLLIEPLIVVGAWVALWAQVRRRLVLAALLLLLTTIGPWGINFHLALVPLALGLVILLVALVRRIAAAISQGETQLFR